ncbi:uncharacterized protein LOC144634481 isoform X2 [Oculina patagonica]
MSEFIEQLLQPNREERQERRERKNRKAICQITLNLQNVGCGCLVYDPLVEDPWLSKYCIITSNKVISDENLAGNDQYHVLFERVSSSENLRSILLNDITKKIIILGSGVVLVFIDSTSPQLHHGCGILRKKCSVLKRLPKIASPGNESEQFCYIGNEQCKCRKTNGMYALEAEDVGSIPCGSILLECVGQDINAVGIISSVDQEQGNFSPIWLKSSLQELVEEDARKKEEEDRRKEDPAEIQARGEQAVEAYNKALQEGSTPVMRVPLMIIGQSESGKTSLKRSLMGEKHRPDEQSTDLVEKSPSYFSVKKEIWKTGERNQETISDSLTVPNRIALAMMIDLRKEGNVADYEELNMQDQSSKTALGKSSDAEQFKSDPLFLLTESENEEPGKDQVLGPDQGRDNMNNQSINQSGEKYKHASGIGNTDFSKRAEAELEEQETNCDASAAGENAADVSKQTQEQPEKPSHDEIQMRKKAEQNSDHASASAAGGNAADVSKQTQEQPEKPNLDEKQMTKKAAEPEQSVPEETVQCLKKFIQEPGRQNEENVFSVIWDFGGQMVYYVTHPIFLTANAIYLLVHDLMQELDERAPPVVREGFYQAINEDCYCKKTNEDYLHFWLSSISTLASQQSNNNQQTAKCPPVLLVCTHADECNNAKEQAQKIHGSLKQLQKPYGQHLLNKYFAVNNILSGTGEECQGVKNLKKEVLAIAKQLLRMKKEIPIKWLKFEEALKSRSENGEPYIYLDEAERIARNECEIVDKEQFRTLLNFLHDQRILIHFEGTPELEKIVILDLQWLINLFRSVITIPSGEDKWKCEDLWIKLDKKSILDEELLQMVWDPLLKKATEGTTKTKSTKEITENLVAVMKEFSLLCSWPSLPGESKKYFVPSMLMSHPYEKAKELLAHVSIAQLFVRFRQPRLKQGGENGKSDDDDDEYVQVPMGYFPRLLVKFLQWCLEKGFKREDLFEDIYADFARFPIQPSEYYSIILLCHSYSVEIVVHGVEDHDSHAICTKVKSQVKSILQGIRTEFVWLKSVEFVLSVLCPVCCETSVDQHVANYCNKLEHKTKTQCCMREKCLHFWSLTELQKPNPKCGKDTFVTKPTKVHVKNFAHWMQDPDIDECGSSSGGGVSSVVYSKQSAVKEEASPIKEMPPSDFVDYQSPSSQESSSEQALRVAGTVAGEAGSGSSGNLAAQEHGGVSSVVYSKQSAVKEEASPIKEMPPSDFVDYQSPSSQESSSEQALRVAGTVAGEAGSGSSGNLAAQEHGGVSSVVYSKQSAVKEEASPIKEMPPSDFVDYQSPSSQESSSEQALRVAGTVAGEAGSESSGNLAAQEHGGVSSVVYSKQSAVKEEASPIKEMPPSDFVDYQSPSSQESSSEQALRVAGTVAGEAGSGSSGNLAAQEHGGVSSVVYSKQSAVKEEASPIKEMPPSDFVDYQSPSSQESSSEQALRVAGTVAGEAGSGSSGNLAAQEHDQEASLLHENSASKTNENVKCDVVDGGVKQSASQVQTRLSTNVKEIPLRVYSRVCKMLNGKRERFDDFRMLAEKVGLTRVCVEQLKNPTHEILKIWSWKNENEATVGKLIEFLKEKDLKRWDVVKVLKVWVNEKQSVNYNLIFY